MPIAVPIRHQREAIVEWFKLKFPGEEKPEEIVKNKLTLGDVCKVVSKNPARQPELLDSMAQPITLLSKRFMATKIKEEHSTY